MKNTNKYFHLYLFFIECLGALCFYWGFFPASTRSYQFSTMDDLPNISHTEIKSFKKPYKKHFDKSVIIVIDSLRYDFLVLDKYNEVFFPYLNKQLDDKNSCLLKARVQTPTVTLPRIKSLLTGTIPVFLDVIANFGKSELNSDNIINQAKENGYKAVFFGDETWINLLPHAFMRSEGTVSFFVSDFIEVDLNVTRNVEIEMDKDDWDIMILHYLGLDHIGHLEGPRSKLVKPKLLEMDNVISVINEKFKRTNKSVLIVICGDHGMKDSGGHGGSTLPEVMIPVAILNYGCDKDLKNTEFRQIDLVPLLSVLLGIPIPADSIGKLHYKMLKGLDMPHSLYALFYNTLRLSSKIVKHNLNETNLNDDIEKCISNGIKFFELFLNNHSYGDYLNSAKYFSYIQDILSNKLVNINVTYDLNLMISGMLLFSQSLFASIFGVSLVYGNILVKLLYFVCTVIVHYILCYLSDSTSVICSFTVFNISLTLLIYLFLIGNLFSINYSRKIMLNFNTLNQLLIAGTLLHKLSLTSSSYIEEEHQFWYFIIVTLFLFCIRIDKIRFSLLLICHRFLRCLNQTGDKWASLPDIEDWFIEHDDIFLSIFCIVCLISVFVYDRRLISNISSCLINILTAAQFISIFLYKKSGSIKISHFESSNVGIMVARSFWIFTFLKTIVFFKSLKNIDKSSPDIICVRIISFVLDMSLVVFCLLYKPHNLIIIPSLLFYSHIFVDHFKGDTFSLIYLHNWLGTLFYFYQGNSNSISTIDVTAGYVGLENFNFYITGIFISLNTFSAPILAFLLMLRALAKSGKLIDCQAEILHINILIYCSQIIVYSFILIIQRHHLFIWSVFAPKLLYIMAHILLNALLILMTILIIFYCEFVSNSTIFSNCFKSKLVSKNYKER